MTPLVSHTYYVTSKLVEVLAEVVAGAFLAPRPVVVVTCSVIDCQPLMNWHFPQLGLRKPPFWKLAGVKQQGPTVQLLRAHGPQLLGIADPPARP